MTTLPRSRGTLVVVRGPMFAGKTTELIRRAVEACRDGQKVVVIKPMRDTRYATDRIVTHGGDGIDARAVEHSGEVLKACEGATMVVIDEVHFFGSAIVGVIRELLERGVHVVMGGVDLDHRGAVFEPFDELEGIADETLRLTATCAVCGKAAVHTQRMSGDAGRIVVGGVGMYEPRCTGCFEPSPG
jgi:thymidine kinase